MAGKSRTGHVSIDPDTKTIYSTCPQEPSTQLTIAMGLDEVHPDAGGNKDRPHQSSVSIFYGSQSIPFYLLCNHQPIDDDVEEFTSCAEVCPVWDR